MSLRFFLYAVKNRTMLLTSSHSSFYGVPALTNARNNLATRPNIRRKIFASARTSFNIPSNTQSIPLKIANNKLPNPA